MLTLKEALFSRKHLKMQDYTVRELKNVYNPFIIVEADDIIFMIPEISEYYSLLNPNSKGTLHFFHNITNKSKFKKFLDDLAAGENPILFLINDSISSEDIYIISEMMEKLDGVNINHIDDIISELLDGYNYTQYDLIK